MTKRFFVLVIAACFAFSPAGLVCAQQAQEARPLTVATYNIENAFDVYDNPYTKDEGTDVKLRWEYGRIAAALKAIDADVVGFQEVENEAVLQALVDEYLPGMGYGHVAVPLTNDARGIRLGLISRLPIHSISSYRWQTLPHPDTDRTWRFARDLFHARLVLDNGELLHVFVVHLKSKSSREGDPQSTMWRSSEAMRIHQIIGDLIARDPDAKVVLIGDFNSQPGEPAISALLAPAPDGSPLLTDSHQSIPMAERTTYPSERFPNAVIDYILTGPAMTARLIPESATVYNHERLTKGSDHLPVVASFDMSQ